MYRFNLHAIKKERTKKIKKHIYVPLVVVAAKSTRKKKIAINEGLAAIIRLIAGLLSKMDN